MYNKNLVSKEKEEEAKVIPVEAEAELSEEKDLENRSSFACPSRIGWKRLVQQILATPKAKVPIGHMNGLRWQIARSRCHSYRKDVGSRVDYAPIHMRVSQTPNLLVNCTMGDSDSVCLPDRPLGDYREHSVSSPLLFVKRLISKTESTLVLKRSLLRHLGLPFVPRKKPKMSVKIEKAACEALCRICPVFAEHANAHRRRKSESCHQNWVFEPRILQNSIRD